MDYARLDAAVAARHPYLTATDRATFIDTLIAELAGAYERGATPAVLTPNANGDLNVEYLTVDPGDPQLSA